MTKRTLVVVVLFLATASFAWTYDVVLKNGKIVNGTFISEDEQKITIRDHSGIVMNFKKTSIDLEKTEAANKTVEQAAEKKEPEKKPEETVQTEKPKKPAKVYSAEDLYRLRSEYPMESGAGVEYEEGAPESTPKGRSGEEWQQITQDLLAQVKSAEAAYEQASAKCKEFQGATIQTHIAITSEGKPTDLVQAKEQACQMAEDAKGALDGARQQYSNAVEQSKQENVPQGYIARDE